MKTAITDIKGTCVPMMIDDIDTDIIIPAQHLTQTSKSGYGEHAFARLKQANADFVLNQPRYQDAAVLLAGDNFGCGSSREHAVWAIQELGFKAIIAPSFADIFSNNARKNGLVLITQSAEVCQQLAAQAETQNLSIHIDLQQSQFTAADQIHAFSIPAFFQHCLIHGLDELDYLMQHQNTIKQYHSESNQQLFINTQAVLS